MSEFSLGTIEILRQATSLHKAGKLREAALMYEEVVAADPANGQVLHLLGVVYTRLKDYARAIDCLQRCSAMAPEASDVANSLGMALYATGQRLEAIACFEKALVLDPANAKAANNLGNAHFEKREIDEALHAFEKALQVKPDYLEARSNLGHCLVILGKPEDAVEQFNLALRQSPSYRHAIEGLVNAYSALERNEDIVQLRRQLTESEPLIPSRWVDLGEALQATDRYADAVECFEHALEINPRFAPAHARMGWAYMEQGRMEDARHSFERARDLDPESCLFRDLLVRVTKVVVGDGTIDALRSMLPRAATLPVDEQVHLHFALGKALADIGENEASFEHYLQGNRINRANLRYDEKQFLARLSRTGEVFTPQLLRNLAGAGDPSPVPIFILGMPRTGSTLVEQILAAHPGVVPGGELNAVKDIVQSTGARTGSRYPEFVPSLSRADLVEIGERYVDRIKRTMLERNSSLSWNQVLRVTDKLPGNFAFVGLIRLALPNARFIYTRRDPVETCLSCFRIYFQGLNYSNDLGELGRYYRACESLMTRWKALLPPEAILEVVYEELVGDIDRVARNIVAHCGLEWDDACLAFQEVDRPVRTASIAQVRRPLYKTSLQTWRPRDEVLRPLIEALAGSGVRAEPPPT